jgi:hypothetical protein
MLLGVVTASPHPYSREWHRLRTLRFPQQPHQGPHHWLRELQVRPSTNHSPAFGCSLHVRVVDCSHGDRFGKGVAESSKLSLLVSEAKPPRCQLLALPAAGTSTPNPLQVVWVRCLCFSGPQQSNINYPMLLHPPRRGSGSAAPSRPPRPGKSSRDGGHLTLTPAPAIVQSSKLQNLPSLFYMQTPPYN